MKERRGLPPFYSVEDEVQALHAPSHELAFLDKDFMLRDEIRGVRLQLEYSKPEMIQRELKISSTIVIFGSARTESEEQAQARLMHAETNVKNHPHDQECKKQLAQAKKNLEKSFYYEEARRLSRLICTNAPTNNHSEFVIVTGGGPGIMEAANRGAYEANTKSIGLGVLLPKEEASNPYITPELNFQFHYFAIRKMHLLIRAQAMIFFPGGFGTLDELFEVLTLMQTNKITPVPVLLFSKKYWSNVINFKTLIDEGSIDEKDVHIFQYVESAEEAWQCIVDHYNLPAQ